MLDFMERTKIFFDGIAEKAKANPDKPVNQGECKAYRCWESSFEKQVFVKDFSHKQLVVEVDNWHMPYGSEERIIDFCNTMEAAGVRVLYVTNSSTALLETLHVMSKQQWNITGFREVCYATNFCRHKDDVYPAIEVTCESWKREWKKAR